MVSDVAPIEQNEYEAQKLELSSFVDASQLPPIQLEYFKKSEDVPRYVVSSYPEGFISDNVHDHTLRCLDLSGDKLGPSYSRGLVRHILFLHDLPEVEIGDHPVVNDAAAENRDALELEAARKIMSPEELRLFIMFNEAEAFLYGKTEVYPYTDYQGRAMLCAKLLDSYDGNLHFNRSLTQWVKAERGDFSHNKSLEWMFHQYEFFTERINRLKIPEAIHFKRLLTEQVLEVEEMWKGLEMPELVAKGFAAFNQKHTFPKSRYSLAA